MLNQFILVGRVESIDKEDNKCILTLRIPRNYKNENGKYDNDIVKIQVFDSLSDKVSKYCKKDEMAGIRGIIQSDNILLAEKISILSSKKEKDSD